MRVTKKDAVVKAERGEDLGLTAWAGVAPVERLACSARLWSDARRLLPERIKGGAGYSTVSVVAATVYGLPTGGQGTYASQTLREDKALLGLIGLEAAPEEATVVRALGQIAELKGERALGAVQRRLVRRLLDRTARPSMLFEGFFPVFMDGSDLEVGRGTDFEGARTYDGATRLTLGTMWAGPYLVGQSFAAAGEDERAAVKRLIGPAMRQVIGRVGLTDDTLFLLDSLYGDEPFLEELEKHEEARHVVGANKLQGLLRKAAELPDEMWRDTGADPGRRWSASGLCSFWFQGETWKIKRLAVVRRWKNEGEMTWNHAAVLTNLEPADERMRAMVARLRAKNPKAGFEEAVWRLYDRKQALENQFKDALSDMGLHHPPSAKLANNGVFYAIAALALALGVGLKRIALPPRLRGMRLWRMRRELFAIVGRATRHARRVVATLHPPSDRIAEILFDAVGRLETG